MQFSSGFSRGHNDSLDVSAIPSQPVGSLLGADIGNEYSSEEEVEQFPTYTNPMAKGYGGPAARAFDEQHDMVQTESEDEELERFDIPPSLTSSAAAPPPPPPPPAASATWQRAPPTSQAEASGFISRNVTSPAAGAAAPGLSALLPGGGALNGASAADDEEEDDDEFGYAFDGGRRVGATHTKAFKPAPAPAHLITDVKNAKLDALTEEEEEMEEEEDEEMDDTEGPAEDDEWGSMGFAAAPSQPGPLPAPSLSSSRAPPAPAQIHGFADAQEASWDQAVRRAEAGAGGRPDPYAPAPTLSAPLPSINRDPAAAAPFFSASGPAIPASFASAMVPQTAAPAPAPQHENDADATFCLDDFDLEIASSSDGYSPEDAFEGGEGYAQDQGRGQGQGGTMRVELPPHLARGGEMSSWAGREGGNGPSRPDDPSAAPRAAAAALGPSLMDRSAPNGAQGRGQGQGTEQGTAAAAAQSRRASGPPLRPESSLAYEQEPAWMAVAPARPPTADQNSGPIREPPQPPPRSSIANMHEGAGGRATGREYEDEAEDSEWDQDGGVTLDMDVTMMEQDDEEYRGHIASSHPAPQTNAPEDEWQAAVRQREDPRAPGPVTPMAPAAPLQADDALRRLARYDYSAVSGSVVVQEERSSGSFFSRMFSCCAKPTLLADPALEDERLFLFCLARTPLSNQDALHIACLENVYRRYTGWPNQNPVARFGPHWDDVGFQGTDPATDLRGAGMLGLLQFLELWENHPPSAKELMDLSRHPTHNFPLAVVSINATRWALEAARAGKLNREANRLGSYAHAMSRFHCGALYTFYRRWRQGGLDMTQSGFFFRDLEKWAAANVAKCIQAASEYLCKDPTATASAAAAAAAGAKLKQSALKKDPKGPAAASQAAAAAAKAGYEEEDLTDLGDVMGEAQAGPGQFGGAGAALSAAGTAAVAGRASRYQ